MKLFIREAALRDLDEIAAFLGDDSPRAAIRFLDSARQAIEQLAHMPELGAICGFESPKAAGVRVWTLKGFPRHLVFYRPILGGIEVIRILHGARDIDSLFSG